MKTWFLRLQVIASALAILLAFATYGPLLGALVAFMLVSAFVTTPRSQCLGATLTATEILADTLDAFKLQLPMLSKFSTRFTAERVALNGTLTGHIRTLPTASTYDGTTGYENGATSAASLLTDLPITVDQHPHVPIKITHLSNIAAQKSVYQNNINDAAYVLAKAVLDNVLAKAVAANFSESTVESVVNTDRDTLGRIRKAMNARSGQGIPRVGIVNSDVFEQFDADSRIASKDFYGQQTGGNPLGHLTNVAGFSDIWEYPGLPHNSENLSGFFCDPRAIALVTGLPNHNFDLAGTLGLPKVANVVEVTDPDTGLTFLGIMWQKAGTFDIWMTVTLLFGVAAGKQAGSAGTICDYAGNRLVTA
jgi:hypothetical protein